MARTGLDAQFFRGLPLSDTAPTNGQVYVFNSATMEREPQDQSGGGGGSGTVTSVSVVNANGISGSVANATTTPAITLDISGLDATKIADGSVSNTEFQYLNGVTSAIQTQLNAKQGTITFGTGVQTALGVNVGSAGAVVLFNGALGTPSSGNLANCTFPTLNQNTTGSAATLTTTRTIWGQNFNGSANVTGNLALGASDLTITGSIAATGSRVTKGWFTDLEITNAPTLGGVAIPSISSTNTLTNKRITRRLTTTNAPGATPTTNTDNVDIMKFTGLATDITSMSTNLSGTPVEGDKIEFIFLDNGTARAITRGASFAATTVPLPTTTVISTKLRVGFERGGSTRDCIAVA